MEASSDLDLGQKKVSDSRWRIGILIATIVVSLVGGGAIVVQNKRGQDNSIAEIAPPSIPSSAPGGKNTTETYRELVATRNVQAADAARHTASSAVVSVVGAADLTKKPPIVAATPKTTYTPPPAPDPVADVVVPTTTPTFVTPGSEPEPEPLKPNPAMLERMKKMIAGWQPGGHADFYDPKYLLEQQQAASGMVSTMGVGQGAQTGFPGTGFPGSPGRTPILRKPLIQAGSTAYAALDMTLDTDIGGPVRATILQGEFKGGTLLGTFKLKELAKQLTVTFSTLTTVDGRTLPVNAIMIDPELSLAAMRSEVDNHYLVKFALPLGAAFLAGFGTPTTSVALTSVGGISGQNDDTTNSQRGLAAVGYTALDLLKDQAKRPPTVRLFAGTGIGILFQTDVFPLPQGRG